MSQLDTARGLSGPDPVVCCPSAVSLPVGHEPLEEAARTVFRREEADEGVPGAPPTSTARQRHAAKDASAAYSVVELVLTSTVTLIPGMAPIKSMH